MRLPKIKQTDVFKKDLKELSAKEVSVKYKLSITSVYRYKQRYGLNLYFSDNVPVDFVEYAKTHNKTQAKEHYITSYYVIRKWEWLANCKCNKNRGEGKRERNLKIKELSTSHSYSEIGKMFGITKQRVEQIVNKEN